MMKRSIFFMLLTIGSLVEDEFPCPTKDGAYMGRRMLPDDIPSGRFGSSLFKIKSDTEIIALADGVLGYEIEHDPSHEADVYRVVITNSDTEVIYFRLDSVFVEEGQTVELGQPIGSMKPNSVLVVKILIDGKHITPAFTCSQQ